MNLHFLEVFLKGFSPESRKKSKGDMVNPWMIHGDPCTFRKYIKSQSLVHLDFLGILGIQHQDVPSFGDSIRPTQLFLTRGLECHLINPTL